MDNYTPQPSRPALVQIVAGWLPDSPHHDSAPHAHLGQGLQNSAHYTRPCQNWSSKPDCPLIGRSAGGYTLWVSRQDGVGHQVRPPRVHDGSPFLASRGSGCLRVLLKPPPCDIRQTWCHGVRHDLPSRSCQKPVRYSQPGQNGSPTSDCPSVGRHTGGYSLWASRP